jgi:hypothetical protein
MRLRVIALAVASTVAGVSVPLSSHAQPSNERADAPHGSRASRLATARAERNAHGMTMPEHPASDVMMRTAVPPDLDQRRRDGHMTADERRLLRQHIEDAVRELYKR